MIQANELRLDNWLLVTKPNYGYQKVNPKTIFNVLYDTDDAKYEPIPITPEILEKAGFVQDDFIRREFNKGKYKVIRPADDTYPYLFISNLWNAGQSISWLHQLQNLYFWVAGEELEITLQPSISYKQQ